MGGSGATGARAFGAFLWAYVRVNLAAALEYRVSTLLQIVGMCLNDLIWVLFWVLYFTKFPVLNGWGLQDVLVLWATLATSFGIVGGLFVNALRIPSLVVQGQLDYYLALPKDVLLHLLVSQIRVLNLGDLLFGPLLLLVMVDLTPTRLLVFTAATLLAAIVFLGFFLASGSLTFWLGNTETLSGQLVLAMLHLTSYPTPIFSGGVKALLYTVIPAGFVTAMPVALVRQFDWLTFAQLLAGAVFFLGLGVGLFRRGLRRYESGNLMVMRG